LLTVPCEYIISDEMIDSHAMATSKNRRTNPSQRNSNQSLILSEFLPYRLSVVSERISRTFANRYEERFGLSIPEWRVMAILGESSPLSTQEVIEQTQMDRVRVSRAVIRLSDKNLLSRKSHPKDQRAQLLALSPQGKKVYRQIVPMAQHLQSELATTLEPTELRALEIILTKLHIGAKGLQNRMDRAKG